MTKKLISVWLSLTILLFSSISIYAEENVTGKFFVKDIVINGTEIYNEQLQFPFFIYKNATYLPLTGEMEKILGIKAEMDMESRTLKLLKAEPTMTNITDRWKKSNKEDVLTQEVSDMKVLVYELESTKPENQKEQSEQTKDAKSTEANDKSVEDDAIQVPKLSFREIDLEGLPLLSKGGITYLPIRPLTGEDGLGWETFFDTYTGMYISTKSEISAQSYWNQAESQYRQGLTNYIISCNGSYTATKAQDLVRMFAEAAEIYQIDEKILIAVAQKESTFNANAKGSSGSLGMMQVMPATGAGYGLTREQLLDAETSINFGAMYLSDKINAYNGDLEKGFSAYNQGPGAVNRGSYSTRYATRVIDTINKLDHYLVNNGYGLGEN